jgi:hypothetical protein
MEAIEKFQMADSKGRKIIDSLTIKDTRIKTKLKPVEDLARFFGGAIDSAPLNFNKEDGQTSYGFLIPDNLSPDILKNIDTITKQVKQKILSTDQGITINTV